MSESIKSYNQALSQYQRKEITKEQWLEISKQYLSAAREESNRALAKHMEKARKAAKQSPTPGPKPMEKESDVPP